MRIPQRSHAAHSLQRLSPTGLKSPASGEPRSFVHCVGSFPGDLLGIDTHFSISKEISQ